jgi:hypothetical protein
MSVYCENCEHLSHRIIFLKAKIAEQQKLIEQTKRPNDFPKVICLCGSTRFTEQMLVLQWQLTKQGRIVLSWCALPATYSTESHIGDIEGVKEIVDEVHKRKIDLADEVFVLNVGGYIGQSTRSEIDYAIKKGKPVKYLETIAAAEEKK